MIATFRPIEQWPQPLTVSRKNAPFRASYSTTLNDLDRELTHLKARGVVIQLALKESEISLNGTPYHNARPSHPGVIIAFETPQGAFSYPCDTYREWQQNIRAITLALAALRAVDRYGVTKKGEQYRGWVKLDVEDQISKAAEFVSRGTPISKAQVINSAAMRQAAYKIRATQLHPDRGGNHDDFVALQRCMEVLG